MKTPYFVVGQFPWYLWVAKPHENKCQRFIVFLFKLKTHASTKLYISTNKHKTYTPRKLVPMNLNDSAVFVKVKFSYTKVMLCHVFSHIDDIWVTKIILYLIHHKNYREKKIKTIKDGIHMLDSNLTLSSSEGIFIVRTLCSEGH